MRKRIWRLADDEFDTPRPEVKCTPARIEISAPCGRKITGSFTFEGRNNIPLRGLVYSSNPYVVCTTPQFDGMDNVIAYEVDLPGAGPGDVLEGEMTIVANQVVAHVPYQFTFTPEQIISSEGEIRTPEQFAELAKDHWKEAMKLFFTAPVQRVMEEHDASLGRLCRAYHRGSLTSLNMDHFLEDAGLKEPVKLEIPDETRVYEHLCEPESDTIVIAREGWGYDELRISVEGSFVTIPRTVWSTDDFVGEKLELSYVVHPEMLHAGINLARINITADHMTHTITVKATSGAMPSAIPGIRQNISTLIVRIWRDYESYRLHRMNTPEWCHRWIRDLEELRRLDPKSDAWYQMLQAMSLIANGQREEADLVISSMRQLITDQNSPEWAFLTYLRALQAPDEASHTELISEIDAIYHRHPNDVRLFWCLLTASHTYTDDPQLKYRSIHAAVMKQDRSPLLFLEAYEVVKNEPYLLSEADDFACALLSWVRNRRAFTAEISESTARIASQLRKYTPVWSRILEASATAYPTKDNIKALIAYLVLGSASSGRALGWYERAIREDISVTGLYEAYMMSLPDQAVRRIPPMAAKFFQYANHLPVTKLALLYANIISFRQEDPKTYEEYLPIIDQFAEKMMIEGRIDDNIAIIYNDYLSHTEPTEVIARAMAPLLFVHKVSCTAEGARRVMIWHDALRDPVIASITNRSAYLPVYGKNHVLVLEDDYGGMSLGDPHCGLEPLIDIDACYPKLSRLAPDCLPYLLHALDRNPMMKMSFAQMRTLLKAHSVSEMYRMRYYPMLSAIFHHEKRDAELEEHFLEVTDIEQMSTNVRNAALSAWIHAGKVHRSYMALRQYPSLGVEPEDLAVLASQMTQTSGTEWTDDFLIALGGWLAERMTLSGELLTYLIRNYVGSTARMIRLWQAARENSPDEDLGDLEERILVQELYSEQMEKESAQIFEDYFRRRGNRRVADAYLNYWAHRYLLDANQEDTGIPAHIFHYIFDDYEKHRNPSRSCMLALMKRLCLSKRLTNAEYGLLDRLMGQAVSEKLGFSFFRSADRTLVMKYMLYDRFYFEYQGEPQDSVHISYRIDGGELHEEAVPEMYCGLYVKEMVLFPGQTVEYEIMDERLGDEPQDSGERTVKESEADAGEGSAYDRLSGMAQSFDSGDLARQLVNYREQELLADQLFPVL